MDQLLALLKNQEIISFTDWIGIIGGMLLLLGAIWKTSPAHVHPKNSIKERLFALGGIFLLIYSVFYAFQGGNPLYILLEVFICIGSRLKMLKDQVKNDMRTLAFLGISLITIGYLINKSQDFLRFVFGFVFISTGYVLRAGTLRYSAALTIGSFFISIFSYLEASRIFLAVNAFFTLFAAHQRKKEYLRKMLKRQQRIAAERGIGIAEDDD